MKVVYRNHIELIKKELFKKQSLNIIQMLERGEGDKKWISGAN